MGAMHFQGGGGGGADWWRFHHGRHHGGGNWIGPAIGFGAGVAIGSALAAPYYDAPYYAYDEPPYVYEEVAHRKGRLGRSYGCPAVRTAIARALIHRVKNRTLVYAWHPSLAEAGGTG